MLSLLELFIPYFLRQIDFSTNKFINNSRPESSMAFLDSIFNPTLGPLMNLSPFWGILIMSLLISLAITLVYKYFSNQTEMKRLKDEQKEYQKKMKELRDNPQEMMKVQKEAMGKNFEYMKHSFKPTLITMLPILLIFGWMTAHLSFEPIYPGETYTVTAVFKPGVLGSAELAVENGTTIVGSALQEIKDSTATWSLKSTVGEHFLTFKVGQEEQTKKILTSTKLEYESQMTVYDHSDFTQIKVNYNKLRPMGPDFTLLGWQPGWLGLYIITSLVFSVLFRKVFNIY